MPTGHDEKRFDSADAGGTGSSPRVNETARLDFNDLPCAAPEDAAPAGAASPGASAASGDASWHVEDPPLWVEESEPAAERKSGRGRAKARAAAMGARGGQVHSGGPDPFAHSWQEAEPRPARRGLSLPVIAAIAVLSFVVIAATLGTILLKFSSGSHAPPAAATTAAPPSGATASMAASTPPPATPTQPTATAPADARVVASPSGNITCQISSTNVTCGIREVDPTAQPACGGGTVLTATLDSQVGKGCEAPLPGGAPALAYGTSAVVGQMACTSLSSGMTCVNRGTNATFSMSRAGIR